MATLLFLWEEQVSKDPWLPVGLRACAQGGPTCVNANFAAKSCPIRRVFADIVVEQPATHQKHRQALADYPQ